jgi:hypothetical protein
VCLYNLIKLHAVIILKMWHIAPLFDIDIRITFRTISHEI